MEDTCFALYAKLALMLLMCMAGYALHRATGVLAEAQELQVPPEVYRVRDADRLSLSQASDPFERDLIGAKMAADARDYLGR